MERGVKLLKSDGHYGIIVSSSFLRANFGGPAVFAEAKDTYVCIPLLSKTTQAPHVEVENVRSLEPTLVEPQMRETGYTVPHERLSRENWSLYDDAEVATFHRLCAQGQPLGKVVGRENFFRGITIGLNSAFVIPREVRDKIVQDEPVSAKIIHPVCGGEDVREYLVRKTDKLIIFTRRRISAEKHPMVMRHLKQFKADLTPKKRASDKRGRKPGNYKWYEIDSIVDRVACLW